MLNYNIICMQCIYSSFSYYCLTLTRSSYFEEFYLLFILHFVILAKK